nr:hypothetical protein RVX_2180 [Nitratidesulfovibrio sp. HK-II]
MASLAVSLPPLMARGRPKTRAFRTAGRLYAPIVTTCRKRESTHLACQTRARPSSKNGLSPSGAEGASQPCAYFIILNFLRLSRETYRKERNSQNGYTTPNWQACTRRHAAHSGP